MSINIPLFNRIYVECNAIIDASKSPAIIAKRKKLASAYKKLCQTQDAELQEFYSIVHELKIYHYLLTNGCKIEAQDDRKQGPDFKCQELGYIECVSVTKGEPGTPARKYVDKILSGDWNRYKAALPRITSSLKDKKEKYQLYLNSGVLDTNKPRLIAINTSSLYDLRMDLMVDLCLEILFGIGNQVLDFDFDSAKSSDAATEFHIYNNVGKKDNTRVLQLDYFSLEEFKNISAIILVNNTIGEDIKKEQFTVFVNPNAAVPLYQERLNCARYFIMSAPNKYQLCK